jgi:hypothetical protein
MVHVPGPHREADVAEDDLVVECQRTWSRTTAGGSAPTPASSLDRSRSGGRWSAEGRSCTQHRAVADAAVTGTAAVDSASRRSPSTMATSVLRSESGLSEMLSIPCATRNRAKSG